MPYTTTHCGVEIEFTKRADGSVDLIIQPERVNPYLGPPTKINSITWLDKHVPEVQKVELEDESWRDRVLAHLANKER